MKTFFAIPGYSKYLISINGKIKRVLDNELLQGSRNTAGYWNFRLTDDAGKTLTWGRHRLMAFVFKHPGVDIDTLYVNHKNGIKGDDFLDNLEWTTPRENVEHAGLNGLTSKCTPMEMFDNETGEIHKFNSIITCAEYFGVSKDTINWRCKTGPTALHEHRYQYRTGHSEDEWPIAVEGTNKRVMVKCVKNGDILKFPNITSAATYLKVSLASMTNWLNQKDQPVLPGYVQVQFEFSLKPWRRVIDPVIELSQFMKTSAVAAIDASSGQVISRYPSTAECAKAFNLGITTLSNRLKKSVAKDNILFRYICPVAE